MQSGLLDWQKRIERVHPITSLEIEPMKWQNPVSRAAAAATIHVYPRAAAAAIALKFHPKHEKKKTKSGNFQMYHFIWLINTTLGVLHNIYIYYMKIKRADNQWNENKMAGQG